jgi:hypothetical protein
MVVASQLSETEFREKSLTAKSLLKYSDPKYGGDLRGYYLYLPLEDPAFQTVVLRNVKDQMSGEKIAQQANNIFKGYKQTGLSDEEIRDRISDQFGEKS